MLPAFRLLLHAFSAEQASFTAARRMCLGVFSRKLCFAMKVFTRLFFFCSSLLTFGAPAFAFPALAVTNRFRRDIQFRHLSFGFFKQPRVLLYVNLAQPAHCSKHCFCSFVGTRRSLKAFVIFLVGVGVDPVFLFLLFVPAASVPLATVNLNDGQEVFSKFLCWC